MVGEADKSIKNLGLLKLEDMNAAFHKYMIEGVPVNYRVSGELRTYTVKRIDFADPEENEFHVVNQYTVIEYKNKRPDVLVFVNGIPLVLFELKNITSEDTTIENAYKQVKNYQMDIPSLFYYNAFNVISDGLDTRMGTITSDFTRYMVWKSENGEKPEEGRLNYFSVLLNGVFPKVRLLDLIRKFIVFQNCKSRTIKIIAGYHQYFAVRKAVERTRNALEEHSRKVGVVWHTQGSGKSLSMVFYTGCIVSNPEFNNPTIVVLTDRNDLDNQLFDTFCSSSKLLLWQTPKQAKSREHLKELLRVKAGGIIFTTIQKFEESSEILSERSNIIFMADEASETAIEKSKSDLSTIEAIIGSRERLSLLADDIIVPYEDRQYVLTGKAMIVCMSRHIAIHLYRIILEKRPEWKQNVKVVLTSSNQDDEDWHDIIGNKAYRDGLMLEFKDEASEFKIAIVVDMWLTGFDVPSMATMYIDKPMKGHNLMQTIARVNRVYKDKEAGLIVDYIGMAAELKSALSQYTKRDQDKIPDLGQALSIALEKLEIMRDMFYGFDYSDFFGQDVSIRLDAIANGVNFALTGVVKSQLFSEKMQKLLKMYNNRLITSAEVIEELLNLSKEMTEAYKAGDEKGLSTEELAFYDALVADPEVLRKMQDKVLVEMAQELTELIRRSRTVDWDKKESARAYMRTQVKHLLRKYDYPPEKAKGAVDIVIKQAELMSSNIKPKAIAYDFQAGTGLSMVAEDLVPYDVNTKQ